MTPYHANRTKPDLKDSLAVGKNGASPKVAIVGGGIGALAFANSLQHAGIDYVLFEKGESLDPQIGASIGILPNGARILDQLGCLDDLASMTVGMESTASHRADGSLIGNVSDSLRLMHQRTGYAVYFLDRQLLLRTLARHIREPERVHLKTSVTAVDQYDDKAVVHCADGSKMEADIVVGADGVHSIVRQEMWRHAELMGDAEAFVNDKQAMSAEYKCLFGISESLPGMAPGQTDRTYAHNVSTLSYVGKGGRLFWFIFKKMDQTYYPPHIPKFGPDDVQDVINEIGNLAIRQAGKVTVADLYRSRVCCNLVAIEEAAYQNWNYGRLVCLGDAIHKMTPNLGAGASSAMESAAVLANVIVRSASTLSKSTSSEISKKLQEYHKERELRIGRAMAMTNRLTRVQALQTKKDWLFTHHIAPRADDYYAESFSSFVIGAPRVDFLPVPTRSLQGTMPFNPKQGWGYEESTKSRTRRAWPLVALALVSALSVIGLQNWLYPEAASQPHRHTWWPNATSKYDSKIQTLALSQCADATYGLFLLEATRLNNKATYAQIPVLFGMIWTLLGLETTVPLYFFLLYIYTPIEKFRASDNRLTDISYDLCIGPLIILFGAAPKLLQCITHQFGHDDSSVISQWIIPSRPVLFLAIMGIQMLFARFIRPSTIRSDRLWAVHRDVMPIRCTIGILTMLTSVSWFMHLIGVYSFYSKVSYDVSSTDLLMSLIMGKTGIAFTLSVGMWLTYAFLDLRRAGMTNTRWMTIGIWALIGVLFLGPGSLLMIGWQRREEILISRRHRDAVIESKI